ncbi:MAG: ATP-grasp domain-containing protein [Clostridia bacterium]|nr:ATP-grasp domain-containing protein [Clostridia bacterium]
MKNFVFISPNFPITYWHFCRCLKNDGLCVLGIGDCPPELLLPELVDSLEEYRQVSSLENYDEVYRAVAYYAWKYGRIDWLESNNEYWLEQNARLRTDFNITSGFKTEDMPKIKLKSAMKEHYENAGIKTARYRTAESPEACKDFAKEVGYPIIVKPDNGVGANDTYKLKSDADADKFFAGKPKTAYIAEEFIDAEINSYDAVIDSRSEPMFETGNVTPCSIMDVVNTNGNSVYYIVKDLAEDVRAAGRAIIKELGVRSRFVHCEFFRLLRDQHIGKRGELVALEYNMRPSGGYSPDMMNYANSTDVYRIWADMVAYDSTLVATGARAFCAFAGRRTGKRFLYSEQDIRDIYRDRIKVVAKVPDALSPAMGNTMYLGLFDTKKDMDGFYGTVLAEKKQ